MIEPLVDVIVPVHDLRRSFEDAVDSASSERQGVSTTVSVVMHNTSVDELEPARRRWLEDRGVRCHEVTDRISSPSGPRNAGLEVASAPFVSFLDSDDILGARCLRILHETATLLETDVALPSIITSAGPMSTPFAFGRRRALLDPVKHQLFRRSHCFGLIRRSTLIDQDLRFPAGIRTGQDLVLMSQLYTISRTAIALDATYHLRDHALERLTVSQLPPTDHVAATSAILDSDWVSQLDRDVRAELVHRLVAINLARGWRLRISQEHRPSARLFQDALDRALELEPHILERLSMRDLRTLHFDPDPPPLEARGRQILASVVASNCAGTFALNGPFADQMRSWLVRQRVRWISRAHR